MGKKSVGILMYRFREGSLEVFFVHPGGPLWQKRDSGAWSIRKGEFDEGGDPLETARRELHEETGFEIEEGMMPLAPIKQSGGKLFYAWAVEGDCDPNEIRSNLCAMEWPPHSGKQGEFAELDRAALYSIAEARDKRVRNGDFWTSFWHCSASENNGQSKTVVREVRTTRGPGVSFRVKASTSKAFSAPGRSVTGVSGSASPCPG